jgi:hypothetical protein
MNIKHFPLQIGLGFALAIVGVVSHTPTAQAQSGNQSDTTGAIVTTSDIVSGALVSAEGGELVIVYITRPIEEAVNGAASLVNQQLAAGNLPVLSTDTPTAIPLTVQQNIEVLLTANGNVSASAAQIESGLVSAGADASLAANLVASLRGLNSGGTVDAAQFQAAIEAYNALINGSPDSFVIEIPEELRAIRSVLGILLNAGLALNQ